MHKIKYLPKSLILYLTYYCSNNCQHCFLVQKNMLNTSELDYNDIIDILDDAMNSKVFLIPLTGGEPLLHPKFFDIVSAVKTRNMLPFLGSSSELIDLPLALELEKAGISCVQMSLDHSQEEFHDKIRGKGSFNKTLSSIENLKKTKLKIIIAICIDKNNYFSLNEIINLLYKYNIDSIKIQFYKNFFGNKTNELTNDQIEECINKCKIFMNKINNLNFIHATNMKSEISNIHNESLSIGANGNIYLGNAEKTIGHIRNGKVSDLYNNYLQSLL